MDEVASFIERSVEVRLLEEIDAYFDYLLAREALIRPPAEVERIEALLEQLRDCIDWHGLIEPPAER